jgi:hypothetical protein
LAQLFFEWDFVLAGTLETSEKLCQRSSRQAFGTPFLEVSIFAMSIGRLLRSSAKLIGTSSIVIVFALATMALPETQQRLAEIGMTPRYLPPKVFEACYKQEIDKGGAVVKAANIKEE